MHPRWRSSLPFAVLLRASLVPFAVLLDLTKGNRVLAERCREKGSQWIADAHAHMFAAWQSDAPRVAGSSDMPPEDSDDEEDDVGGDAFSDDGEDRDDGEMLESTRDRDAHGPDARKRMRELSLDDLIDSAERIAQTLYGEKPVLPPRGVLDKFWCGK